MTDIEQAKALLEKEQATCVFYKGEYTFFSKERGVLPLLNLLQKEENLGDFSVADKVVGKAAAFLYVLLKVKSLYAKVISKHALGVLKTYDIQVAYDELVEAIRNRTNSGFCPMETAVLEINEPKKALEAIRLKLNELR